MCIHWFRSIANKHLLKSTGKLAPCSNSWPVENEDPRHNRQQCANTT